LLHIVVAGLVQFRLAASYDSGLFGVVVCSHAAVPAVLYFCARWALSATGVHGRLIPAAIAVVGPFVQPLVPLTSFYSIGYFWAEPYHSPTYALSKPFALASAAFAVYFLGTSAKPSWRAMAACAASVLLGTLAKPSFMICALPAVVLLAAYAFLRKTPFSHAGVFYGWILPSLAVLGWQFVRTYIMEGSSTHYGDSIIFAPFEVMGLYAKNLVKLYFMSVGFPLSVLLLYGRRAWENGGFRFSLVAFLLGTLYAYTLAEQYRLRAGNFLWSGYIALFILYFFSILFVLREVTKPSPTMATFARAAICLALLAWHVTCGVSVHINYLRLYP
jgi:hypothetical protein